MIILSMIVLLAVTTVQTRDYAKAIANIQTTQISKKSLLEAVNAERAKVGVAPLTIDNRLNMSAQKKANEIVGRDMASDNLHIRADGVHGYQYAYDAVQVCELASENLLMNTYKTGDGIKWWLSSEAHREAMLDPKFSITGFGIKDGYVVEHFCALKDSLDAVISSN